VVRVGFVVSRKVGNAVTRNRVRRRLREALRAQLRARVAAGERPSYDLLVITRPSAAEAGYHALAAALERAIGRALGEPRGGAASDRAGPREVLA
jgi:ribonuclease P protein component